MLTVGVSGTIAPRNAGQRLPVHSRKAERKQQLFCMVDYARPGVASRPQRAPYPFPVPFTLYQVPGTGQGNGCTTLPKGSTGQGNANE